MALAPVAFIAPGCSQQSTCAGRAVVAKGNGFAVCGAHSIARYRVDTRHVPSAIDAADGDGNASATVAATATTAGGGAARPSTVAMSTYALACVYGYGVGTDTIVAYDYNDDYVVCATSSPSPSRALHVWRTSDAEVVTSKALPSATLTPLLQRDGAVTAICLVGKHHCLLGTAHGHLLSVNLSGRSEPRDVALPAAAGASNNNNSNNSSGSNNTSPAKSPSRGGGGVVSNSSLTSAGAFAVPMLDTTLLTGATPGTAAMDSNTTAANNNTTSSSSSSGAAERVLCVAASPMRPDSVACGTRDGTLVLLTLSASTGLHVSAALRPFAAAAAATATSSSSSSVPVTALAFSPVAAQHLLVASREGAVVALCDVAARAMVMQFDYKATAAVSPFMSSSSSSNNSKDATMLLPLSSIAWTVDDAAAAASGRGGGGSTGATPTVAAGSNNSSGTFYTVSEASARMERWHANSKTRVAAMTVATPAADGSAIASASAAAAAAGGGEDETCGVVSVACLDAARVVLGRSDGGVCVYNTSRQCVEWCGATSVVGHRDTLCDCRVSRHDSDVAASCSRDGVVRVWSLRQMAQQYTLQLGAVAVCALDWAANGKHLVVALGSGEIAVYATSSRRLQWRCAVFAHATTSVTWPSDDTSVVVAASSGAVLASGSSSSSGSYVTSNTSGGGGGIVVLSAKEGVVLRRYACAACSIDAGVTLGNVAKGALVAGGVDGALYVYALPNKTTTTSNSNNNNNNDSSNSNAPLLTLSSHTAGAVRCVAVCPLAPHMLLTGADDATVRVWDLSLASSNNSSGNVAQAIVHASRLLRGHSDRVLCVAWCTIAPYLVLSGSADATVRLWDIRNGVAIAAMRSHCGDVCALTTHPERPLLFVSAARDGGVVLWQLALLRQASLDAALGTLDACVVADAAATMTPVNSGNDGSGSASATTTTTTTATTEVSVSVVTGAAVQRLLRDVRALSSDAASGVAATSHTAAIGASGGDAAAAARHDSAVTRACARVQRLVDFFDYPCGAMDVAQLTSFVADAAHYSADARALVVPASHLVDARRARARQLLDKARGRSVAAAGAAHRRSRLLEAAAELLRVGLVADACAALLDAEAYDAALAVAPAVSEALWRTTCVRVADAAETAGDDARASLYYRLADDTARASMALVRASPRAVDAALVLCRTASSSSRQATVASNEQQQQQQQQQALLASSVVPPNATGEAAASDAAVATVVRTLQHEQLVQLVGYGNARLLAAALLARGRSDDAVRVLYHTGDVTLTHLLVHTAPMREQASIDAAYRMSMLQSARQRKWEVALLCATRLSNAYDGLAFLLAYYQCTLAKQQQRNGSHTVATTATAIGGNATASPTLEDKVRSFAATVRQECAKLQLPLDATAIQQRHASDGLASQNQIAAMTMTSECAAGGVTSTAVLQSICGFVESLLSVALQDIDGVHAGFYLHQARNVTSYVALPLVLLSPAGKGGNSSSAAPTTAGGARANEQQPPGASVSMLSNGSVGAAAAPGRAAAAAVVHDVEQRRLLALAYMVAALMSVKVYRLPRLLNPAFQKARELASGIASVEALLGKLQAVLGAYSPHSLVVDCAPVGCGVPVLMTEGRCCRSSLTSDVVFGAVHVLEDGTSLLSKEEALGWSLCCHFSPLASGAHMVVL